MSDPTQPPFVNLRLLEDGTVLLQQDLLHGLLNVMAANCEHYAGDNSGDIIGAVAATCAGYAVGSLIKDRERILIMRERLIAALDAGLADGIEDNPKLPRLHG